MLSVARLVALLSLLGSATAAGWTSITELGGQDTSDMRVEVVGPQQQPFDRRPPRTMDPNLLRDFHDAFSFMQDITPDGPNTFTDVADQYVATIPGAFVEGDSGLVYDTHGRVYHLPHLFYNRTSTLLPMPQRSTQQAATMCERHSVLGSLIQRYGHMYYHFLVEALPRALLLRGALPADGKLLIWGQPYEYEFLERVGFPRDRTVRYDPTHVYCADTLLLPTPTPRITPPREAVALLRKGLAVATMPAEERNLVVYVSREGEPSRRVANEEQLLTALEAAFPQSQLVVFNGNQSVDDTIELFQQAKVVLGPHGAGLSHIVFAAPGTAVVEFQFMKDPPMMFWHLAEALGQQYWMVPVPQAFWMQAEMQVPVQEVVDILSSILLPDPTGACAAGSYNAGARASVQGFKAGAEPFVQLAAGGDAQDCQTCRPGTYAFNAGAQRCSTCTPGRVAAESGSTYCSTCPPGTYSSEDRIWCLPCPRGTHSELPGAWDEAQCLSRKDHLKQMADTSTNVKTLIKLSPTFAQAVQRRVLIQSGPASLNSMSQEELCMAQRLATSFNDPYSGPYLDGLPATDCSKYSMAMAPTPGSIAPAMAPMYIDRMDGRSAGAPTPAPELPPTLPLPAPVPARMPGPPAAEQVPRAAPAPVGPELTPLIINNSTASTAPPSPTSSNALDTWVIALLAVLGVMLCSPVLFFSARYFIRKRQLKKATAAAGMGGDGTARDPFVFHNASYDQEIKGGMS